MSGKKRQKKDHQRKDKERQAMRETSGLRHEQASVRFGEQLSGTQINVTTPKS